MYRKALIPTDGSEIAHAAIEQVRNLLPGGNAQALVVEVVDTIDHILLQTTPAGFDLSPAYLSEDVLEDIVRSQREAASEHLAAVRTELERAGITRVETRIVEGVPGPALVELAHQEGCDVVIMATHGRSGLRRAVLGSVADHVVRHLKRIPVVLIHPDGEEAEEAERPSVAAVA
jgi:nucleotide-binding universal stress UspA family protein